MSYEIKIPIGKCVITIHAQTERQLFEESSLFMELPGECHKCESQNMGPSHRSPQGNDYYAWACRDCGERYKISTTKDGGRMYPKREWESPYIPDQQPREETARVRTHASPPSRQEHRQSEEERHDMQDRFPERTQQERAYPPSKGHGKAFGQQ